MGHFERWNTENFPLITCPLHTLEIFCWCLTYLTGFQLWYVSCVYLIIYLLCDGSSFFCLLLMTSSSSGFQLVFLLSLFFFVGSIGICQARVLIQLITTPRTINGPSIVFLHLFPRHPEGTSTAMIKQGAPQAGASQCLCQTFVHGHKWQGSRTFFPFELFGVDQICVPKTLLQNWHTEPLYSDVQWFQSWSGAFGNRTTHNSVHSCLVLLVDGEEVILLPNEGS